MPLDHIICPTCGTDNAPDRRYCRRSGTQLREVEDLEQGLVCARCAFRNDPGDVFCGRCGFQLDGAADPVLKQSAERRQLTVMFCDLVDSTVMADSLDPEDFAEVTRACQDAVRQAIETYGGFVARYMGDGVLAYFGYPRAHGDDPERAARAGLDIVRRFGQLSATLGAAKRVSLRVRVGIATGLVVVGDLVGDGSVRELTVVGATPNLAARLQGMADPDTVVVAPSTRSRLGPKFTVKPLGQRDLKGFSEPVLAFRVLGRSATINTTRMLGEAPFFGREAELATLEQEWAAVRGGSSRTVLISGVAGVGKTALVRRFLEKVSKAEHLRVQLKASAYHSASPFSAVVRWLAHRTRIGVDDPLARQRTKVAKFARRFEQSDEVARSIGRFLGLPDGDQPVEPPTLEHLIHLHGLLARGQTVLLVVEDAQWLDPSSRGWVESLTAEGSPVLALVTYRPPLSEPWPQDERTRSVVLGGLEERYMRQILRERTGGLPLPSDVEQPILEKSAGVPMFAEELTRALIDEGLLVQEDGELVMLGSMSALAIPATLQESVTARIDRLGFHKPLLQVAAVIGTEVPFALLGALVDMADKDLKRAVRQLLELGLVSTRDGKTLFFEQSLVHEVALDSLLRSRRRELHARIADLLPAVLPQVVEMEPETLAHHLCEAERYPEAIEAWSRAADLAKQRLASAEAIRHLRALLGAGAKSGGLDVDRELEVRLQAVELLRAVDRREEALEELGRILSLAEEHGRLDAVAEAHHQRGNALFLLGEFDRCQVEHERALELARVHGLARQEARALGGLGDVFYARGQMASSFDRFQRCVALAEAQGFLQTEAANRPLLAWGFCWLDRMEEGRAAAERAIEVARQAQHPRGQVIALAALGFARAEIGDFAGAIEASGQSVELGGKLGSAVFEASMAFAGLWARWRRGDPDGVDHARRSLENCREAGMRLMGVAILALVMVQTDDPQERRRLREEGEALLQEQVIGHNHPVFWTLAMEVALQAGDADELTRCADRLEAFIGDEPMGWANRQLARGRAFANGLRSGTLQPGASFRVASDQ